MAFKDKDTMPAPSQTEPAPEVEVQKIAETPLVVARTQRVATTGESVFDRLRSKRNDEKSPAVESKVEPVEPEEATLDDVATAIAAIASDSPAPGPATPVSDGTSEADEPPLIPEAERKAILDSVITEDPKSWRRSMSRSLNDARSDLKMAHASVARLRRKISDIESRRADSRLKIDTSLSRAQTLLDELREGPR